MAGKEDRKRIVCYGDSNTYGWDPRMFSGNRYDHPWPELTAELTVHKVYNLGEPGRVIPRWEESLEWFRRDVAPLSPELLVIMLGTNDLLEMPEPSADRIAQDMEKMIRSAVQNRLSERILLLSCPPVEFQKEIYQPVLEEVSDRYRQLAAQDQIDFADPLRWGITMGCDGVHFSEGGHRIFAEKFAQELRGLGY